MHVGQGCVCDPGLFAQNGGEKIKKIKTTNQSAGFSWAKASSFHGLRYIFTEHGRLIQKASQNTS